MNIQHKQPEHTLKSLRGPSKILKEILDKVEETKHSSGNRISKRYIQKDIKQSIDNLLNSTNKNWSVLKALITSILCKIAYPEWDTRNHNKNINGLYNLSTFDKHICSYLFNIGYYDSPTCFYLTSSLNLSEPFTLDYKGGISPKSCKESFLFLLERINVKFSKTDCKKILFYIFKYLKDRKEETIKLKNKPLDISNIYFMDYLDEILSEIFEVEDSSVIPVIAVYSYCEIMNKYIWKNCLLKSLKEHTASDKGSNSLGDIEGYDDNGKPFLAIEVKHKIKIDETIIKNFDDKSNNNYKLIRYIITTAQEKTRPGKRNNIIICNINEFLNINLSVLQGDKIIEEYIQNLRKNVLEYRNLDIKVKKDIEAIFEKYSKTI